MISNSSLSHSFTLRNFGTMDQLVVVPTWTHQPASNRRRKMRGALDALNRHVSAAEDGKGGALCSSSGAASKLDPRNGNHVSSSPNRISSNSAQHTSEYIYDYTPPSDYHGQDKDSIAINSTNMRLCSTTDPSRPEPALPPPPTYEEAMSVGSISHAPFSSTPFSTSRRESLRMDRKNPRASSIKTAPTVVMTLSSMDDDDDNIDQSCSLSYHGLPSTSRTKGPTLSTEHTSGNRRLHHTCSHRRHHSPSSSSRDASPGNTRRRPHKDSLVSPAHSLASADSVRAELERIKNLGREVPSSAASLSSRAAAESNTNTNDHHDDKKIFRGYNHRRQLSSGLASVGELVGGGSVSSLSHLTPSMLQEEKGSFSSTPRMILTNEEHNHNSRSQDPLSYNFVDSDSDDEDLGDDIHKKTPKNDKQKSPPPKNVSDKNDVPDDASKSRPSVETERTWQTALGA